jgi:hypothetical protein
MPKHSCKPRDILPRARIANIEITGEALVAVNDHRKPPDEHVFDAGVVELPEDPFRV